MGSNVKQQTAIYMLRSGSSEVRSLVAGTALEIGRGGLVATFDESDVELCAGQEITLYFREGRQFQKQDFRVQGIKRGADRGVRLKLAVCGDKTAGEIRGSERYSTVFEGMTATLGDEPHCLLVDIGEGGMALIAGTKHEPGTSLRLEMWVQEVCYRGSVTVCSVSEAPRGRWRFGLSCDADADEDNLRHSLKRLWLTMQMKQLRGIPG